MSDASLVLVVDDEAPVRDLLAAALEEHGFAVVCAEDGATAIEIIERRREELRTLVADIRLGGDVSGWDVAGHARKLIPGLPVVYISGADYADWTMKGVKSSIAVAKPFKPAQVVAAVKALVGDGWS